MPIRIMGLDLLRRLNMWLSYLIRHLEPGMVTNRHLLDNTAPNPKNLPARITDTMPQIPTQHSPQVARLMTIPANRKVLDGCRHSLKRRPRVKHLVNDVDVLLFQPQPLRGKRSDRPPACQTDVSGALMDICSRFHMGRVDDFRDFLEQTGSVVSGSNALLAIHPGMFKRRILRYTRPGTVNVLWLLTSRAEAICELKDHGEFHSTIVMNYFAHFEAVCMYPGLTPAKTGLINTSNLRDEHYYAKYGLRGFALTSKQIDQGKHTCTMNLTVLPQSDPSTTMHPSSSHSMTSKDTFPITKVIYVGDSTTTHEEQMAEGLR
ncbi:hypothetical protein CPB83DRAFT_841024 [Crepidotus variabilis]|uniref:Uncharacterized protein n=1 Tax=Crepidotus variabilis TaxID=179855 RepID=A0A9P6E3C5_9AGAR|nr:hypothetical protein CPB83DRAFT_841024 [Crepidotus variabilis]